MARTQKSHARALSSTFSCVVEELPTLSRVAEARAQVLEKLASDLRRHDAQDLHGDKRLMDTFLFFQDGAEAELDEKGIETLRRLVPDSARGALGAC